MKKYKNYFLAFIIPIIIMLVGMLFNKIYPFGDKILLMLDGYNQYPGFLNTFVETIKGNSTILYSLRGLTGFNLYASFIYYTFNITNLLFLLFNTSHIISFYTIIIILKLGLASLTMYIFLSYLNKDKKNILFSICYGLTAYNLLYYLNYMWFDSIILLPIVMLGIEKIFKENNYCFYTLFLSISIISNFYIGYMTCIFSVIYFIYKYILNKGNKKQFFKYILYSLISGLLSAFVLIPVILELLQGKGELFAGTNYFKFDLDFINVFYKLTIGSFSNGDLEYGTPNVYVSLFVYLNMGLFFFNKNIKLKEKILSFIVLAFFLLSMSFNLIDYFWQMLQMPIYYPVRYAFIFDFYLIYLAFRNYTNLDKISFKQNLITTIIMVTLIIIGFISAGNLNDTINIVAKLIYLGISLLFLVYYILVINSKDFKKFIWIIVLLDLSVNTFVTLRNTGNQNTISNFNETYLASKHILKDLDYNEFNRISFDEKTIKNNGLLLNYNDLNYFSSLRNQSTIKLISNGFDIVTLDGCNTNYYYNNPIVNALLGIKYFITKDNIRYYDLIKTYNGYNIYQNKDITNIGFITNNTNKLIIEKDSKTTINNLVKVINNNDKDILKEIKVLDKNINCSKDFCITNGSTGYIKYSFKVDKDALLFIQNNFPTAKDKTNYEIKIHDNIYTNNHYPYKLNKNDLVEITIKPTENFRDYFYHVYTIDLDLYQEFITNINKNKLEITNYINDANFTGKVFLEEDGTLFTTISNDKGWTLLVDGKKKEISPIMNGFIGLELSKGEHEITFKYFPPGLKEGLIISCITLIVFSGLILIRKRASNN